MTFEKIKHYHTTWVGFDKGENKGAENGQNNSRKTFQICF